MNTRAPKTTTRQKLALIISAVLAVLLLGELVVRSADVLRGRGFFSQHRNQLSATRAGARPFRMFGVDHYRDIDDIRYVSSRHGEMFVLDKPADTFRIVMFGGSTTENSYTFLNAGVHFPHITQTLLRERLKNERIEVINVANNAYSTAHSLVLLELDVLSWKPDLVVLSHNINDLLAAYWPDFRFDYSNKYRHAYYLADFRDRATAANVLLQHFQIYWVIKNRLSRVLRKRAGLTRRPYGFEIEQTIIDTFERNLRSFVTLAEQHGVRVMLATQPLHSDEDHFFNHMAQKPYNDIVTYPLHQEFIAHHEAYNKVIEKVAGQTGTWFLNNNPTMNDKDELFVDYVHYSAPGVQAIAENYADFIAERIHAEQSLR